MNDDIISIARKTFGGGGPDALAGTCYQNGFCHDVVVSWLWGVWDEAGVVAVSPG